MTDIRTHYAGDGCCPEHAVGGVVNPFAVDGATVLYAVRYCLGRQSYAAEDGARLVTRFAPVLTPNLRQTLLSDLLDHLTRNPDEPDDIRDGWNRAYLALRQAGAGAS